MESESLLPYAVTAFNPIIIRGTQSSEGEESGEGELILHIGDNQYSRKKEYFNGQALFDLSGIIQKHFKNMIIEVDDHLNTGVNKIFIDHSLFVNFSTEVTVNENGWDISDKCALNAVVQAGESSDKSNLIGKILNRFSELKLYNGYPQHVYGLTLNEQIEGESLFSFVTTDGWHVARTIKKLSVVLSQLIFEEQFFPVSVEFWNAGVATDYRNVVKTCVPDYPFYVRWINQNGGRDYFMFIKSITGKSSKTGDTFKPEYNDIASATSLETTISASGEKKVLTGSGFIDKKQIQVLSDIVYSPKIEWYNEELQKWIEVRIDNPEIDIDTQSEFSEIILTFILPEVQLQF